MRAAPHKLLELPRCYFRVVKFCVTFTEVSFAMWPNCSKGEYLMTNSGAGWLSCTIRSVEQIMERHGFEEDEPKIKAPSKPISSEQLSLWGKLLRAARPLLRFRVS